MGCPSVTIAEGALPAGVYSTLVTEASVIYISGLGGLIIYLQQVSKSANTSTVYRIHDCS